MIEQILSNVKTYIPSYWPLQSFIATNPMFGLTHYPFDECMSNLGLYIPINGTLPINYYHQSYANGKISLSSLRESIKEFLTDKKIFNEDTCNTVINILINQDNQVKLEQYLSKKYCHRNSVISDLIENKSNYIDSERLNIKIGKFLADFLDLGQAGWAMPTKSNILYNAWLEYSANENSYIKTAVKNLPSNSHDAIFYLAQQLKIPGDYLESYLVTIVFKILGWCSLVKWLEERPDNPYIKSNASVSDILAIWLCSEYALSLKFNCTFSHNLIIDQSLENCSLEIFKSQLAQQSNVYQALDRYNICLIWQRALEKEYQVELLNKLTIANSRSINTSSEDNLIKSQLVFCIDTRSEGIRRKLESIGNYQTFGFAGFFGIGFRLYDENTHSCSLQCPAIVKPDITLINKSVEQKSSLLYRVKSSLYLALGKVKNTFFAPLVLFDIFGTFFSISLLLKTLLPSRSNRYLTSKSIPQYSNKNIDVFDEKSGFTKITLAEKANFVLNAIGLTTNFAPFVIIAGHIAESDNNPFQSSLDCGACGGNGGIPNSIAFCQALNDTEVRNILQQNYNINIPPETIFVSTCHNTTTDMFHYYNLDAMTEQQLKSFHAIQDDINLASNLLREERLLELYGEQDVNKRKSNWAELIPEMALANNAAFIIAPRKITQNINLGRRVFLHSYEPELDPNGEILDFILNAPVIVGHWINSQYYFSTTDSSTYGAGNKAIHNMVSGFGIMEGNFSDLKIGLPYQSIFFRDKLMHQPLRLTVFIYAKKELVNKLIAKSEQLNNLFSGRWLHLEILDPEDFN